MIIAGFRSRTREMLGDTREVSKDEGEATLVLPGVLDQSSEVEEVSEVILDVS